MKRTALIVACGIAFTTAMVWAGAPPTQPDAQPEVVYSAEPWSGAYLGVDTQDITADRLDQLHLKEERGVEVTMVDQDAPAGKAGIREHDVILSINDQQVQSVEQLRRLIREVPPGRSISIGISRDGQVMTLKAQLAERNKMPYDDALNISPAISIPTIHIPPINMPEIDMPGIVVIHSPRSSGLMVENLTPQLGDYFGVKGGNGVLVRSVEKGSRGEQAGFRAGDIIVKINGSAVNDCSDFSRLLRGRATSKAAITVMREHKEQNLTLTLPEPRRSGSLSESKDCGHLSVESCGEALRSEMASLRAQVNNAGLNQLMPNLEHLKQEFDKQGREHREQWKNEMKTLHEDMRRHQQEFE
ncbi:MAG: PDZ domain-containing protein, partial [Acidobacteria bacterium]|nr:PDZ domain-containing protein [Acidobacteriota bacterium]